ncbi:MAG: aldo/keto reductase [Spirochaetales bacterium]|nr:aldo/keto reductase [Spirochaetales bacterium]
MSKGLNDCTMLSNGVNMPWLGFGVFKIPDGDDVVKTVNIALEIGYRSIDTASIYGNERGVGKAIKESSIPREEIFITTKIWNSDQGYDNTLNAFEESLKKLDIDYVDLYLIHWPGKNLYIKTWKAMERIYQYGRARAIGVSNFHIHHLHNLMSHCDINPMVNQVEFHPFLLQPELIRFCMDNNIQIEAWSPLTKGLYLHHPVITTIAEKYNKTPAQVLLRWDIQHCVVCIPKSVHRERIEENTCIFDFELVEADMDALDALNEGKRLGPDPNTFF